MRTKKINNAITMILEANFTAFVATMQRCSDNAVASISYNNSDKSRSSLSACF